MNRINKKVINTNKNVKFRSKMCLNSRGILLGTSEVMKELEQDNFKKSWEK